MKYSQVATKDAETRGQKIMKDWEREAGHQPGMVFDVLNLEKKVVPEKDKAA